MLPYSLVIDFRDSSRQKPSFFIYIYKLAAGVDHLAMISLLKPSWILPSPTLVLSTEESDPASRWGMERESRL